jgi:hypothetical protein
MLGYYKAELERRGLWPVLVDDLAHESPLLAASEPYEG